MRTPVAWTGCAHIRPPHAVPSTEPRAPTVSNTIPTGRVGAAPPCRSHPPIPGRSVEPVESNAGSEGPGSIGPRVRRHLARVVAVHDPPAQHLACGEPSAHVGCAPTGAEDRRSTLSAGRILRRAEQPPRGGPLFPVVRSLALGDPVPRRSNSLRTARCFPGVGNCARTSRCTTPPTWRWPSYRAGTGRRLSHPHQHAAAGQVVAEDDRRLACDFGPYSPRPLPCWAEVWLSGSRSSSARSRRREGSSLVRFGPVGGWPSCTVWWTWT